MTNVAKYMSSSRASFQETFDLAIIIPTFNRASKLEKLLTQLSAELDALADRVQVIISNNASNDHTDQVVNDLLERSGRLAIEYYVQRSNIGPNRNIHFLVEQARANYVWCISDDDLLVSGRVKSILELITDGRYSLVLCRATGGVGEWDHIPQRSNDAVRIWSIDPCAPEAAKYLFAAGFLASVILKRDQWLAVLDDASKLFYTCYANWAAVLYVASRLKRIGIIDTICVLGNASASGPSRIPPYEVLVMGILHVWKSLEHGKIKSNLKPYIMQRLKIGWRSIAVGINPALNSRFASWIQILRAYIDLRRQVGAQVFVFFHYFMFALLMPTELRRPIFLIIRRCMRNG